MTRIALISDIHANEVALRAVLAEVFRNLPPGGFHFASSRQLGVAVDGPLSLPRAGFAGGRRVFLPPLLAVQFDDILAPGLTTIFPAMRGWIEQKYSYSPGAEKV